MKLFIIGPMKADLDSKDIEILKILRKDSRTPMTAIGEALNISKATVSRRIARMEEEGLLDDYHINIDFAAAGVMKSLLMINVGGEPAQSTVETLKTFDEIGRIYTTFGDHNILCEVYTANLDILYKIIQDKILNIPCIRNVEVDVLVAVESKDSIADIKLYEKMSKR